MAKTLVACKHDPGPHENGFDGCHARIGYEGLCPGLAIADWLNSLGEDEEQYIKWESGKLRRTNGQVRDNWLSTNFHIVAVEPELARLKATERRLSAELRQVKQQIKRLIGNQEDR